MVTRTAAPDAPSLFPVTDVEDTPGRKARILAIAEPTADLPAVVGRDGTVISITLREAAEVIAGCMPVLTVDVETTGYPIGHKDYALRTVQLGNTRTAVVLDAANSLHRFVVAMYLYCAQYLMAYSATADLVPLVQAGLTTYDEAWGKTYDVMLAAKLSDPNTTGTDAGLKSTAAALLPDAVSPQAELDRKALFAAGGWLTDTDVTTPVAKAGWAQVNPRYTRMVRYAASDVLDTAALVPQIPRAPRDVLSRERAVQRITARISHDGMRLDPDHIAILHRKHTQAKLAAEQQCASLGLTEPGSPKQVATALTGMRVELPVTEAGNPSVAAPVLRSLAHLDGAPGQLVGHILDYRHHATVLSTFLEPYRLQCAHGDGRVRPTIYTLSARTGRMSCVRPNMQNVPRGGGIRACCTADPSHLLVSADLAGIEMRVAALLSGDSTLTKVVLEGSSKDKTDLHWLVAKQVFGPNATKANRYTVKPGVYGRFYGGGAETLADEMGCTEELAQEVIDGLDRLTPEYTAWCARLRKRVQNGNTEYKLYTGATLHLPVMFPHKAPNYVIQRTARELLVDALLRWRDTPYGHAVVLPIHDEMVVVVPEADATNASAALLECMTTDFQGMPITAAGNPPAYAWADAD